MKKKQSNIDAAFTTEARPKTWSRGGISEISELTAPTVEIVRGEFLNDTFDPKVTLTHKSITFNAASVQFFPDNQYVTVGIDKRNLRLVVQPTTSDDRYGIKFANIRNGKNIPRSCTCKFLCQALFDMMLWEPEEKHRILATVHVFEDRKILTFDLEDAMQILPVGSGK